MSETKPPYLAQGLDTACILEEPVYVNPTLPGTQRVPASGPAPGSAWRSGEPGHALSTLNLDELERELMALERKFVPLLNRMRAMRGKKPIVIPPEG